MITRDYEDGRRRDWCDVCGADCHNARVSWNYRWTDGDQSWDICARCARALPKCEKDGGDFFDPGES